MRRGVWTLRRREQISFFFPGIEPPFFDRSALSSATKPPIICILHTNSTQNTHTCSPVNTVGLYKSAKQESFPAT